MCGGKSRHVMGKLDHGKRGRGCGKGVELNWTAGSEHTAWFEILEDDIAF